MCCNAFIKMYVGISILGKKANRKYPKDRWNNCIYVELY